MKRAMVAAFAALCLMAPLAAEAHSNHGAKPDRAAVEKIVRDYLLKNPEVVEEAIGVLRAQSSRRSGASAPRPPYPKTAKRSARTRCRPSPAMSRETSPWSSSSTTSAATASAPCRRWTALLEEDANVRVVWKEFPILGPVSDFAARAAMAADRQGRYYPFHLAH